MKKGNSLLIFWFCSILLGDIAFVTGQSVSIDLNTEYQSISGFGGIQIPSWTGTYLNEDLTEKAFGNDPGKIGLTILRLRIDPDSNQFYRELPMALHAVERGAIVFASPWNPPAEMLDPTTTYRRLLDDYYDDYVTHLNRYNKFMADSGVSLYAISVQNEPDIGDWTQWTAAEMIKFLEENAQDIESRVIAPESFQFRRPFTDSILNDAEATANLDIVGGHIYGGGLFDYPLARDKAKEVWMTEHLTGSDSPESNTWSLALDLATEINDCMKANFNAYVWWYIRRFYGLITDDGNISKKGSVMSQFSKFIRPGAVRVDGIVSSAPNLDATAYKTDSSMVIIVVNHNSTSVDLDFTILNGIVDTLTQFTSSATKNVVNDGGVSISGGTFSVTVDAESITTFSSYSENGGSYGNISPIADAGSDIDIDDTDNNGSEIIMLDGTSSTDTDGAIANYSWALDGMQIFWEPTGELDIDIGTHELILTVTDNDGASHSDTISIIIRSLFHTDLYFEAECGQVGSNWNIIQDTEASNEFYVTTPAGQESLDGPSADTADQIIIPVHLSEAGVYKVWGRVITPTANDDSFWIRIDNDTTWALWNSIPGSNEWHWEIVFDQSIASEPVEYALDVGDHTLSICYREDGALLDKIFFTNTGAIPDGLGDADTSCPDVPDNIQNTLSEGSAVLVFPNPAENEVQLRWITGFNLLQLVAIDGRKIIQQTYPESTQSAHLELNIEPGIYFLLLSNGKTRSIAKLIVE